MRNSVRVREIRRLTDRIKAFALSSVDGGPLPKFTPGAHIDVDVGAGDKLGTRSYSLCGAIDDPSIWHIAVLRELHSSGGSAFMHDVVKVGDTLMVSEPKNDFPLAETARHHVLVAGGIGITPILAMARHLASTGRSFEVHYCGRTLADLAFVEDLEEIAGARLKLYLDGGNPSQGLSLPTLFTERDAGTHLYVCGPSGMICAAIALREETGYPASAFHIELFTAAAAVEGDIAISVELARSGRVVEVDAKTTILDALLAAGLELPYECKRGECGICAVPVVSGDIVHRDFVLGQWEKGDGRLMCICISRSHSPKLVLDL